MKALLVLIVVAAVMIVAGRLLDAPLKVELPYVATWRVAPVGTAFDAPPMARPPDWQGPSRP